MSMLAGPRRKQKVINLRAKNNAWSSDGNKFGQRMLEKMGWSSGKGLGANENGIVEHVVARYKNDEKGLGFEDKNDQWTKHEDDFNALLANLSNGGSGAEKLHSGISLEVKSKESKARVHYHKFTRGKDLTRYSEKDLANIFGKKSLKNEEQCDEPLKAAVQMTEQIFTEKGSMEDYFKNKLASFKAKANIVQVVDTNDVDNESADYAFQGFSANNSNETEVTRQHIGFSVEKSENSKLHEQNAIVLNNSVNYDSQPMSKKKKKKKSKDTPSVDNFVTDSCNEKSQKKRKHLDICTKLINLEETSQEIVKVKKSKKNKNVIEEITIGEAQEDIIETNNHLHKKKIKSKNKLKISKT